jgi:hypothetical protein
MQAERAAGDGVPYDPSLETPDDGRTNVRLTGIEYVSDSGATEYAGLSCAVSLRAAARKLFGLGKALFGGVLARASAVRETFWGRRGRRCCR